MIKKANFPEYTKIMTLKKLIIFFVEITFRAFI